MSHRFDGRILINIIDKHPYAVLNKTHHYQYLPVMCENVTNIQMRTLVFVILVRNLD